MRVTTPLVPLLGLASALLLVACGGGGGVDDDVDLLVESVTLPSVAEFDGVVDVSGFLTFNPSACFSYTGDLEESYRPGYEGRQLYAFPLSPIPDGARIERAELQLHQRTVVGDPYGKNGVVVVDHVDYMPSPGPDSYDGQTLARAVGTLSTDEVLEVKTLDVTGCVTSCRDAAIGWAQFRLRFDSPVVLPILDHVNDYVRFTDAEGASAATRPQLVVWYQP